MIRVQHVDTEQGPILKNYNLANISISSAATVHTIPMLELKSISDNVRQFYKDTFNTETKDGGFKEINESNIDNIKKFISFASYCLFDEDIKLDFDVNSLERVFNHIEDSAKGSQSEGSFAGLFDDFDVNSNKLGATVAKRNDKLAKLLSGVADMNLGVFRYYD